MFENIKMEIFIEHILLKHWEWFYEYVMCINRFDILSVCYYILFFHKLKKANGNISTMSFNTDQCNQQPTQLQSHPKWFITI